jgi:hypothetical protein
VTVNEVPFFARPAAPMRRPSRARTCLATVPDASRTSSTRSADSKRDNAPQADPAAAREADDLTSSVRMRGGAGVGLRRGVGRQLLADNQKLK